MLINNVNDAELAISSNNRYQEVTARQWDFVTTVPDQEVTIAVAIPFTMHQAGGTFPAVAAWRLYLDGNADNSFNITDNFGQPVVAKQWNGDIITNEGRWCYDTKIQDGSLTATLKLIVPTAGQHSLRLRYSGSTTAIVGTLRSRARVQVW